jgi:hypothetical protein
MDTDDAEVLAYLDSELGTEDGSEPEELRDETEEPESTGRREQSFHGDGFEDDEEEDDDSEEDGDELDDNEDGEDDEDGEDGDDLSEDDQPQPDPREARLKAIAEAVERKQREAAANIRRERTANQLMQIHATATAEEWEAFQKKLMDGYQAKLARDIQERNRNKDLVIAAFVERENIQHQQAQDAAGREMAMIAAEQKMGGTFSAAERAALDNATADNFMATFTKLVAARSAQTEPAREKLREKRQQKRADSAPLRENGGARAVRGDYNNYDDIGSYLDDVFAGM